MFRRNQVGVRGYAAAAATLPGPVEGYGNLQKVMWLPCRFQQQESIFASFDEALPGWRTLLLSEREQPSL